MTTRVKLGAVGGITPRVTAQRVRAADATQYAANDHIANTTTAASVTPLEFAIPEGGASGSGVITAAKCVAKAASGALVTADFAFDLLLFRPVVGIPYAAGSYPADNAALTLTAAMMNQMVGRFTFSASGWYATGVETGAAMQIVGPASGLSWVPYDLQGLGPASGLRGILRANAPWNPGAVAQTLDFELFVQAD
jgi:hypothetical protein